MSDKQPKPEIITLAEAKEALRTSGYLLENRLDSVHLGAERLPANIRSLASEAMATLPELISGSDVPPAVRLRASP